MTAVGLPTALVLWDVDHTLVNVAGMSRPVYERAFTRVFGRPLRDLAVMTGRTERAIILETLIRNGIAEVDALLPEFYAALAHAVQDLTGEMRAGGAALPGASAAIGTLPDSVVQSVALTSCSRT